MVIFYVDVRIGNKTVGEIRNKFIYLIFSKTLKSIIFVPKFTFQESGTIAYQLVINVSCPAIFSSLNEVLESMDGVTIEKKTKSNQKTTTEVILADKELMASIERGEKDLVEGKSKRMTAAIINNLLGL